METLIRSWKLTTEQPVVSFLYQYLDKATADHSIRVARSLFDDGYPADTIDVGLFHDFLEDAGQPSELLLSLGMPQHIYSHVVFLTHNKDESYNYYIDKIRYGPEVLRVVKIYDIVDNLSRRDVDIKQDRLERLKKKYRQALFRLAFDG